MIDNDDLLRGPDKETNCRRQNEKETIGCSSHREPPPWKVGQRLGDFILEELLGSGSSGFVYRVLDVATDRRCALKLLRHGSPDDLLRNKLGFRRMMSIEHPNLLRVDRIHQLGDYTALSMEEVCGSTLVETVRELRQMEPHLAYATLLKLIRDYASGLAVMHANGYIHRDVKPENLMVDSEGNGRVIDYGLVDAYEMDQATFSANGFLLGTPHYFAPEVVWSQRYLPACDIFSLGIVLLVSAQSIQRASLKRQSKELRRSKTNQFDDADRIDEALEQLENSVPSIIRETCREMLDQNPADRPTAARLSRLGLPPAREHQWTVEEPLLGRDAERQQLHQWILRVFAGDSGRFHLSGPSGIGKSRLVREAVGYIEGKNWGQIFSARCRPREDQPLQAFDQLCDSITNRYMQGDREPLALDPVSIELLQGIFPVLENVLTPCMQLAPTTTSTERLDALEAAARLSEQLRLVGPLFLVIDDAQWADRDSLNVLDRLQSAAGPEGLGIITVSRDDDDLQHVPADVHLRVQPLDLDTSIEILSRSAQRWSVDVSEEAVRDLAQATAGSPFRLRELADEFRPGGALCDASGGDESSISQLGHVDRLWKRRVDRLNVEARRLLPYVVVGGGRMSTQQLGELTRLRDSVDAAISELARERLISDQATGGECITVFHDRVAEELGNQLSDQEKVRAHKDWASLLARQDDPEKLAARIAGHLFAANLPGQAVAHAVLAAEDCERMFAKTEAARWYARVVEHVDGDEKTMHLRNAARCYREADFPDLAAEYYQRLSTRVDADEQIECKMMATVLLLRSGRCAQVREMLKDLAESLRLPKPKGPWQTRLAIAARSVPLALRGRRKLLTRIATPEVVDPAESAGPTDYVRAATERYHDRRTRLCLSLTRPMSVFDNLYAAELSVASAGLAMKYGDPAQCVHVAVGKAVFDCYDQGPRRTRGELAIAALKDSVVSLNDSRALADWWAGFAYSHALACRWDHVTQPVQRSAQLYHAVNDPLGFELAHTEWLGLWADWHLGRWGRLSQNSSTMMTDSVQRNDHFLAVLTCGGFGAGAWLADDRVDECRRLCESDQQDGCGPSIPQFVQVLKQLSVCLCLIYENRTDEAWNHLRSMERTFRRTPYEHLQLVRVSRHLLGVITCMHKTHESPSRRWIRRSRSCIRDLRSERIAFCRHLADLYDGLLEWELGKSRQDSHRVERARRLLRQSAEATRQLRLRPYQLAAEDALGEIESDGAAQRLRRRMTRQGVVRPERLRRLYTVAEE